MKRTAYSLIAALLLGSGSAWAANPVTESAIGGAIGGAAGAVVGHQIGGRDGAIIGGALGGAAGVAVATSNERPAVRNEAPSAYRYGRYYEPGSHKRGKGHYKHWKRDHPVFGYNPGHARHRD
ncbi:glycine zipper 2TM domain-containing protein [Gulbenkiania mobilis]|uniref:Glycine zipper 2TM domain-containing protein n=1 Tax=Gulbenkiania mobilis TaxID=397457 RepID=A0ABY2CUK2_GULMO|nr:hypothetical protein EV669_10848 [Gulbenkiania mobilis]